MDNQIVTSLARDSVSAMEPAAVLDCISTPVLLMRPDGLIVHVNVAGSELLRNNSELRQSNSRLTARRSSDTKALTGVMARLVESQRPEPYCLFGRDGSIALILTITPISGSNLLAVCIVDLRPSGPSLAGFLKRAFGLSSQNAQLAEGLMYGLSLAEFSSKTSVTLGATRTRLKKLFACTGSKSQAALVSMLWRAATIAPPSPQAIR